MLLGLVIWFLFPTTRPRFKHWYQHDMSRYIPVICQKVDMLIVICSTTQFGLSGSKQSVGLVLIMWSFLIWVMVVAGKLLITAEKRYNQGLFSQFLQFGSEVSFRERDVVTAYVQLRELAFEFFDDRHCIFSLLLIDICTNIFMVWFCCHKNFRLL